MNPAFLARLAALQQQNAQTTNTRRGMSLSSVKNVQVDFSNDTFDYSKVLVIPTGLGKTKTDHFARLGANMGHDDIEPEMIVAGSRGTALVKELLLNNATHLPKRVILFGPVHLRDFLETAKAKAPSVKILIVHGQKDTNERIEMVRVLVQEYKNQVSLVEVEDQGHSLDIDLFRLSFRL